MVYDLDESFGGERDTTSGMIDDDDDDDVDDDDDDSNAKSGCGHGLERESNATREGERGEPRDRLR